MNLISLGTVLEKSIIHKDQLEFIVEQGSLKQKEALSIFKRYDAILTTNLSSMMTVEIYKTLEELNSEFNSNFGELYAEL